MVDCVSPPFTSPSDPPASHVNGSPGRAVVPRNRYACASSMDRDGSEEDRHDHVCDQERKDRAREKRCARKEVGGAGAAVSRAGSSEQRLVSCKSSGPECCQTDERCGEHQELLTRAPHRGYDDDDDPDHPPDEGDDDLPHSEEHWAEDTRQRPLRDGSGAGRLVRVERATPRLGRSQLIVLSHAHNVRQSRTPTGRLQCRPLALMPAAESEAGLEAIFGIRVEAEDRLSDQRDATA